MFISADDVVRTSGCGAFEDAIIGWVGRDDVKRFGRSDDFGKTCDLPLRFHNFLFRPPELIATQYPCHSVIMAFEITRRKFPASANLRNRSGVPPNSSAEI